MTRRNKAAHQARKRFGQHFLSDPAYVHGMLQAMDLQPDQPLLEIGPGLGALTFSLLEYSPCLTVIELDRDLAARLRPDVRLRVIEADVLAVDFSALADASGVDKWRICGNLPYNISTPLLFHLLNAVERVQDQHFMMQKEVVERMVATAGSSAYSRLSVMLQWRYEMQNLFGVPPEAFVPPPRVQSAVVRMVPRASFEAVNFALFSELVRVAFSQRRKILRHSLGKWLDAQGFAGRFDLQRRAQEVQVQEFVALAQALQADG